MNPLPLLAKGARSARVIARTVRPSSRRTANRMVDSVFCNNCGTHLIDESPSGDPAQRKPCPRCGSLARRFDVHMSGSISLGGSAAGVLITYPEALLTTAKSLIANGEFSIAVV